MIRLLELCKQLCSGSKSVKGNPGKWNETLKYYAFLSHCFLQKGSTSEAKNLAVEKHTFLRKTTKKNILCWLPPVFKVFFNGTSSLAATLLPSVAKCQSPVQIPPVPLVFFCPKIFIQYHIAIFLICFLICGCTTYALYILVFVSVCICF